MQPGFRSFVEFASSERTKPPDERFINLCSAEGCICTAARVAIVRAIYDMNTVFSVDDLPSNIVEQRIGISRSMVFRTLATLQRAGMVRGKDDEFFRDR